MLKANSLVEWQELNQHWARFTEPEPTNPRGSFLKVICRAIWEVAQWIWCWTLPHEAPSAALFPSLLHPPFLSHLSRLLKVDPTILAQQKIFIYCTNAKDRGGEEGAGQWRELWSRGV